MRVRLMTCLLFAVLGASCPGWASTVTYDAMSLGSGSYRMTYVIESDPASTSPISQFTVFFDVARFANLRNPSGPTGWDLLVVQPDLLIPDDGFLDALVLDPMSAVPAGSSSGPFVVDVDFLGSGSPSGQRFELYDDAFQLIDSGITRRATSVGVPEPSFFSLLLMGAAAVVVLRLANRRNRVLSA